MVAAVVVLIGAGALGANRWFARADATRLTANGTIEATEVTISSEVNARILAIPVVEGQTVRQEDVLIRLDNASTLV